MKENYSKSLCGICWKNFIWACPLLLHHPKNIISCSAYEPTDLYINSKELISKFLNSFKQIEGQMIFQLKNGTWNEDIKNETDKAEYWKGYRYGLQAFWVDFVMPEKEKWDKIEKQINRLVLNTNE